MSDEKASGRGQALGENLVRSTYGEGGFSTGAGKASGRGVAFSGALLGGSISMCFAGAFPFMGKAGQRANGMIRMGCSLRT